MQYVFHSKGQTMLLRKHSKKSKGFLSLDTAFSLVVIIGLAAYVQAKTEPLTSKNEEAVVVDAITHIIEGGKNLKAGRADGYTTMDMQALVDAELVPAEFATATGSAVGGSYTIGDNTSNSYSITIDSMSSGLCGRVASKMGRFITTDGTGCATGTLVVNVGT